MKIFFKYFLVNFFILSSLLFGSFNIGAYSIRIYVALFLFFYLIINKYKFPFILEIKYYFIFILFYFLILNLNGDIEKIDFFKFFFGRYLICFIAAYVVNSLITNKDLIYGTIVFFVIIGFLNGIISLLQFNGNSFALSIPLLISDSELIKERLDIYSNNETGLGVGVVGLFGYIVKNGYMSAVFSILSLYLYQTSNKYYKKLIFAPLSFFLFFIVFLTQQRFVFIFSGAFFLFFFIRQSLSFFLVIFLSISLSLNFIDIDANNLGRISNYNDNDRVVLYSSGIEFVKDNFFLGGQVSAAKFLTSRIGQEYSHNFFLNAFIYSGFFGAIFVILVYFRMIFKSLKILFTSLSINNMSFFIGGSLLVYLINSLTHNSSLVTGDEHIWILFFLLLKSINYQKNIVSKKNKSNNYVKK